MNEKNINVSTALADENLCFNVDQLGQNISVYQYHSVCRNHSSSFRPRCFFDDEYLCICGVDNYRAECFQYDHQLDHCDQCFSHGRCVRGDLRTNENFLCVCPPCHYGHRCQYSLEEFAFTLEQVITHSLLYTATITRQIAFFSMISFACFALVIGAFNNLFMFVTFYRSKFLQTGVGNYLFVGSVINQMTLSFLAFRIIHSVLSITGYATIIHATVNTILCKSLPFALSSLGQLSYWLMSIVAIERLYVTWNIRGRWLKKARIARRIMFIVAAITLLVNAPSIAFFTSLIDLTTETKTATCVVIHPSNFWTSVNQVANYASSLLPLVINIICTGGIMCLVIRQKLLTNKKSDSSKTVTDIQMTSETNDMNPTFQNESIIMSPLNIDNTVQEQDKYVRTKGRWKLFRNVLHENIDLILAPAITIVPQLFSLPYFILGSVMECHGFENTAIRYSFIISLAAFYVPQMFSFFLYVSFSSVYYEHFRSTTIGKKMAFLCSCFRRRTKQQITYSQPFQYELSNTIKSDDNAIIENTNL